MNLTLSGERAMMWRGSTIDPTTDIAATVVLEAFEESRRAGLASVDCYRAGVEAWRRTHPDQSAEYAAKQAVAVILAAKVSLRVEE
ncbi:MAG TPA: hypothetical protein VFX06_12030 [Stellaceae bacterium]|nr:hypothetical protein [Stellaceae bacterium]